MQLDIEELKDIYKGRGRGRGRGIEGDHEVGNLKGRERQIENVKEIENHRQTDREAERQREMCDEVVFWLYLSDCVPISYHRMSINHSAFYDFILMTFIRRSEST